MMRECVERNVVRVDNMEPGEFKPVYKTDPGGTKTVEWHGPQSFVVGLSQPCRRIVRISAPARETPYQNRSAMRGLW